MALDLITAAVIVIIALIGIIILIKIGGLLLKILVHVILGWIFLVIVNLLPFHQYTNKYINCLNCRIWRSIWSYTFNNCTGIGIILKIIFFLSKCIINVFYHVTCHKVIFILFCGHISSSTIYISSKTSCFKCIMSLSH